MSLANKLIKRVKYLFTTPKDDGLLEDIKEALLCEINNKKTTTEGRNYAPEYYQIFLAKVEQKEEILNNDYQILLEKFVKDKLQLTKSRLRNDLNLEFIIDPELDSDLAVRSSFNLSIISPEHTNETGTMVYQNKERDTINFKRNGKTLNFKSRSELKPYLKNLSQKIAKEGFRINSIETNLGRQKTNEIVLPDFSVSRVHAQLVKNKYHYLIKDLNSTNGVIVNGDYVVEKILKDGDLILLGDIKLKFILSD